MLHASQSSNLSLELQGSKGSLSNGLGGNPFAHLSCKVDRKLMFHWFQTGGRSYIVRECIISSVGLQFVVYMSKLESKIISIYCL